MSLFEKIHSGDFVVLGEFEPPKGSDFSTLARNASLVRGRLDALVVPEMANAVLKASSLGACAYLQAKGIDTVFQVCPRDRNRLALQADILSAGALGIANIMAITGEDIQFGDHPHARTVNDLELPELLKVIQNFRNGKDLSGIELQGTPPQFCVGSRVNAGAPGGLLEIELEGLKEKIDLGVAYVVTNPIFDIRRYEQFRKRVPTKDIVVIPTILLLKSAGMARYIDRNVKGISIPAEMIRNIQKAPDKPKACIQLAGETISRLRDMGAPGVLVSTLGWDDRLPLVLDEANL